jgi:hypothetical protein
VFEKRELGRISGLKRGEGGEAGGDCIIRSVVNF